MCFGNTIPQMIVIRYTESNTIISCLSYINQDRRTRRLKKEARGGVLGGRGYYQWNLLIFIYGVKSWTKCSSRRVIFSSRQLVVLSSHLVVSSSHFVVSLCHYSFILQLVMSPFNSSTRQRSRHDFSNHILLFVFGLSC